MEFLLTLPCAMILIRKFYLKRTIFCFKSPCLCLVFFLLLTPRQVFMTLSLGFWVLALPCRAPSEGLSLILTSRWTQSCSAQRISSMFKPRRVSSCCLVAQLSPILLRPPWTGISQARILEWVAIFFSRESSRPRDGTLVSCPLHRRWILYCWTIKEAPAGSQEPPGKVTKQVIDHQLVKTSKLVIVKPSRTLLGVVGLPSCLEDFQCPPGLDYRK